MLSLQEELLTNHQKKWKLGGLSTKRAGVKAQGDEVWHTGGGDSPVQLRELCGRVARNKAGGLGKVRLVEVSHLCSELWTILRAECVVVEESGACCRGVRSTQAHAICNVRGKSKHRNRRVGWRTALSPEARDKADLRQDSSSLLR